MGRRVTSSRGGQGDSQVSHPGRRVASSRIDATAHREDGFVDPRALPSEDMVAKTLKETSGTLGMVARPKIVDFNARLKERRKASTRVVVIRAGIALLAIVAVSALIWLLFFSSVFRLETSDITVQGGNEWVSSQRVLDIANKQVGKSLLSVSTSDVTAQLNDIPGVTASSAKKDYPRSLTVTIQAQKPAAMLKSGDNILTAVDGKGRVLNSVSNASVNGIPVIEVGTVDDGLRSRAVLAALKILSNLPEQMRQRISKVSAQTQDSITTELDGGNYTILWGDASQFTLKRAVVDKIINDPSKIGDRHQIDVSAPLRPIIK